MLFRRRITEVDAKPIDELSSKELVQKASALVVQAQNVLERLDAVLDVREKNGQ